MKIPEYITVQEVQRVCKQLKIRDWTKLKKAKVPLKEARIILAGLKAGNMKIEVEEFCKGLEVELEHGLVFEDANVTNNHPVLTGKIVLAHFMESAHSSPDRGVCRTFLPRSAHAHVIQTRFTHSHKASGNA